MESRDSYNEFLAIHVLNSEHCQSEIDVLSRKPEFAMFLSGIMSLMEKPHPFNVNAPDADPYLVREETIQNIRFVMRVNREGLAPEIIAQLDALELALIDGYIKPLNMPVLPDKSIIYYGQVPLPINPTTTHPIENIYAFFKREDIQQYEKNPISIHVSDNNRRYVSHPAPFIQPISMFDLHQIAFAISRQNFKVNTQWINDILNTPSCFTKGVSKLQFAKTLDVRRRGVECAAFYAIYAMTLHAYDQRDMHAEENLPHLMLLHDLLFGMNPSDLYQVSGSVFKLGAFSKAPLTPDEIKAIPYAFGLWSGVSELISHDDARHIPALVEKLGAAGFIAESDYLKHSLATPPARKPRKNETRA